MFKKILVIMLLGIGLFICSCKQEESEEIPKISFVVIFDSQGGNNIDNQEIEQGDKIIKPQDPIKEGYEFAGWYTSNNILWDFDENVVDEELILFAKWKPKENKEEIDKMFITIYGNKLEVKLENNPSVEALIEILKQGDVIYTADDYGGFEKVGALGFSLPRNDEQITTEPGDVVLYQGNQICIFVGSNTWAYTKLGKIVGYTDAELRSLIGSGKGNAQITISLE